MTHLPKPPPVSFDLPLPTYTVPAAAYPPGEEAVCECVDSTCKARTTNGSESLDPLSQYHTVPFPPGLWDGQGLCRRRLGSIIGIKLLHPSPADCKEEKWCELALLNKGLTSKVE